MNILIIDDDNIKKEKILSALLSVYPDANVKWFENYQDANLFILDNHEYIDLIILDWCFPPNSYSKSKYGMGRQLLNSMLYNNINIKTIISSSDVISINKEDFPDVLGSLNILGKTNMQDQLASYLNVQNYDDINNISKGKAKVRTNKQINGYKRHLSSTPWWMK